MSWTRSAGQRRHGWLQRGDPSLLKLTAPRTVDDETMRETAERGTGRSRRRLWVGLAALMILTPLGLLATGAAWGEWGPQDFSDPQIRGEIKSASGDHEPPAEAPQGMARLASIWTAPMPDYAPPFMHNESFGYIMSAMVGVGLIILASLLIGRITQR